MRLLRDIIHDAIHDLGISKSVDQHRALVEWHRIVGESISKVTEPQRVSRGTLFVQVQSDSWRHELHYRKSEIISTINGRLGSQVILDIIFI